MLDPVRLQQILFNLISNAIKFTQQGGIDIHIGLDEPAGPEGVLLHGWVKDTGMGIPQDKQELIFEAFAQEDASTTRQFGGTGLGLTICARLAHLMGGKIWVESQVGQGSTFHFTVCAGLAQEKAETWQGALSSPVSLSGLRILLAEDDHINQFVAKKMLEGAGHQVTIAEDGQAVLDKLETEMFDLILMDVQMPNMNGLEATRQIRLKGRETGKHLPIIGLTASVLPADREACIASGMDDFVSKPVRKDTLLAALEKQLG